MAQRQKIELNFSDVDDFHFKKPLKGYITKIADDHYVINNDDLAIRASGKTPKEAAEMLKDQFIVLANDLMYKSKYAPLSERERKKVNIINSICDLI
ncbi:hypothetical protein [uncultured Brachyspira sp.]|uniref:hypothetical protein n=1 Tax=uncultured Brachyspira sp. TaxID=221953 RepID=UPI00261791B7|nr:hypothetical protein [uncultured Brachyspira sp.]